MQPGPQFFGESRVDGSVALDAAHAGKGRRDKPDPKMRFALAVELGLMSILDMMVAGMKMALVDHGEPLGRKCLFQLGFDAGLYRHKRLLCPYMGGHIWGPPQKRHLRAKLETLSGDLSR